MQEVLKRWITTGDLKCQSRSKRKRKSTRKRNRSRIRISVGNKKLTSKELTRELKDISSVEKLSTPTVRRRLLENGFDKKKKQLLT